MENRKKTFGISAGMGGGRAGIVKMAVCISAFLLSLLCSLIYNAWKYDRISLAEAGQDPDAVMALGIAALVVLAAGVSLVLIIHNAFAAFMGEKVRLLGILSSIGATPAQIRKGLRREAVSLCALPLLFGDLLGIVAGMGVVWWTNVYLGGIVEGRREAVFGYHPAVFLATAAVSAATVWISVWLPAWRLGKVTPLEAIKNADGGWQKNRLKKTGTFRILRALSGFEGELAGRALQAQKRALRTAAVSLGLSFLAFGFFQCFFAVSRTSTQVSYFDRFQGVWDVMVTAKAPQDGMELAGTFDAAAGRLRALDGVERVTVYQKAAAKRMVTEQELSAPMAAAGGLGAIRQERAGAKKEGTDGAFPADEACLVSAPVLILDDASFLDFCRQAGVPEQLNGAAVLNLFRDDSDPNYRKENYLPYLDGRAQTAALALEGTGGDFYEIPVAFYTDEFPAVRERHHNVDYSELVHIMPVSLWKEICLQIGTGAAANADMDAGTDTGAGAGQNANVHIQLLAADRRTLEELERTEAAAVSALDGLSGQMESENRIAEKIASDRANDGLMTILGGFCAFLALIGISGVFSNTLAFVRNRRREIACLLSVGMTPGQIKKMFAAEAFCLAGKPMAFTFPLIVICTGIFLRISWLDPMIFLKNAPVLPIAAFAATVFAAVAAAYSVGCRNVCRMSLAEMLREDALD